MPLAFGGRFYFVRLQRAWPPDTQKKDACTQGPPFYILRGAGMAAPLLFMCAFALLPFPRAPTRGSRGARSPLVPLHSTALRLRPLPSASDK
jgi:hypothetical protein